MNGGRTRGESGELDARQKIVDSLVRSDLIPFGSVGVRSSSANAQNERQRRGDPLRVEEAHVDPVRIKQRRSERNLDRK